MTAASASHPAAPRRPGLVLTALLLAAVVCNINFAAAGVALPDIGVSFTASQTQLDLVGLGTGLGLAMSVLYFGAIADRYGRKQLLVLGLLLTVVASAVSATAPSIEVLIGARVFTGLAAGMAYPTTLSLITALWAEGPGRTRAIALWASIGGMAIVAGGVVAGAVLAVSTWNAAFLLSVPVAIVAVLLIVAVVPSHVGESADPVDHPGGVLSVVGVAALVIGTGVVLAPGTGVVGAVLLGAAVVVIALFLRRQATASFPLFDLQVARRRLFWVPALAGTIAFGSLIGAMFVGEQFMQNVLGYTPLDAGAAVVPAAVGLLAVAPLSAGLLARRGSRTTMLLGYALVAGAFLSMLGWREGTPYALIGLGYLLIGAGAAFIITASSRSLTSSTPVRRVGMASATSDLQNDLGGSIMQALLGAVLAGGFAASFARSIAESQEAGEVSAEVTAALQSSFASAARVAAQHPELEQQILEAARQSLVAGSLAAYLVGAVAILLGAVVVWFGLPSRTAEAALRERYAASDLRDEQPRRTIRPADA
ncbi:MFS transporter [Herbiconiux liukaitaii]|uniref:MFS transporter n=1 Tax=Herbiconiux liukaitaii TaxID=3342799 RepID=UPI0035B930B0